MRAEAAALYLEKPGVTALLQISREDAGTAPSAGSGDFLLALVAAMTQQNITSLPPQGRHLGEQPVMEGTWQVENQDADAGGRYGTGPGGEIAAADCLHGPLTARDAVSNPLPLPAICCPEIQADPDRFQQTAAAGKTPADPEPVMVLADGRESGPEAAGRTGNAPMGEAGSPSGVAAETGPPVGPEAEGEVMVAPTARGGFAGDLVRFSCAVKADADPEGPGDFPGGPLNRQVPEGAKAAGLPASGDRAGHGGQEDLQVKFRDYGFRPRPAAGQARLSMAGEKPPAEAAVQPGGANAPALRAGGGVLPAPQGKNPDALSILLKPDAVSVPLKPDAVSVPLKPDAVSVPLEPDAVSVPLEPDAGEPAVRHPVAGKGDGGNGVKPVMAGASPAGGPDLRGAAGEPDGNGQETSVDQAGRFEIPFRADRGVQHGMPGNPPDPEAGITSVKLPEVALHHVIRSLRSMNNDQGRVTVISIKLEPEWVGEIKIRLSYAKGELAVHFFTSSGAVKEAVEGSLPQLREALAQHNINLGEAAAFVGQEDQGNGRAGFWKPGYGISEPVVGSAAGDYPGEPATVYSGENQKCLDLLI